MQNTKGINKHKEETIKIAVIKTKFFKGKKKIRTELSFEIVNIIYLFFKWS